MLNKMRKELILVFFSIVISQFCFSQNDIIIDNAVINNTETHYGATNSIAGPSTPATPVTITTGDKFVEFVSGNEITLAPGFNAKATVSGGEFLARILPSFTPITPLPVELNDFKIGMFEFRTATNIVCCDPVIDPLDGTGNPTSQLNVLKEDGFNVVHKYGWPGGFAGSRAFNTAALQLVKNNGLQIAVDGANIFKPDFTGFEGTNIYDGYNGLSFPYTWMGTVYTGIYDPNSWHRAKPDYDDLIDNVYSDSNFNSTVWGYRMTEEFSHAQPSYMLTDPDYCWNDCDETKVRHMDTPAHNVADALEHFKTRLNNKGVTTQKLVVMESWHGKSIQANSDDQNKVTDFSWSCSNNTTGLCLEDDASHSLTQSTHPLNMVQGYSQPQDYINPSIMGNNMPDVFFEASYWYGFDDSWAKPYSNIYNNEYHYLGMFKSIDFAYSQGVKEVHKVINIENYESINVKDYMSGGAPAISQTSANGLWFQAYTSIIHGATGIWFWDLDAAYTLEDAGRLSNRDDVSNPNRFVRDNFPLKYINYVRYLAKELAYLKGKNFLSTDPKSVLYSKTDNDDLNCIVPDPLPAYATLRYTIRTNGDEVIMIITNPQPMHLTDVMLNFDQLNNPIIRAASGVDVLFGDASNNVYSSSYKSDKTNDIDLTNLTLGASDTYYMPFWPNKQLQISFGSLDTKILRFKVINPIPSYANDWEKVWTNDGNNAISTWLLRITDHLVVGDFNGDTDDEILCTQQASAYSALLDFDSGDWKTIWSNLGSNAIGTWLIRNSDIIVSGDFDGDNKDEVLCIQEDSQYATMLKYESNSWTTEWSNLGSNSIGTWFIRNSDQIIPGDYDGDGKDEILCIQQISNYSTMLKYIGGSWQTVWSNLGSGNIDNWVFTNNFQKYSSSDFNNDGKDDLICIDGGSAPSAAMLQFIPSFNDPTGDPAWKTTNSNLTGISDWQSQLYSSTFITGLGYVDIAEVLSGNIDYDGKDELMYVQKFPPFYPTPPTIIPGWSKTAEYLDDNTFQVNWNNNASPPYINDWQINTGNLGNRYFLVKANKYSPKYLMALKGSDFDCQPFLVSMYKSSDLTNKLAILPEEDANNISISSYPSYITENEIHLFPNPNTGEFYISPLINERPITKVEIVNVLGAQISFSQTISNELITINMSEMPTGIYFVKIYCNDSFFMKKIVYN